MQGAELLSALSLSAAFLHMAGSVAGSRTLTDVISGSGSAAILSTVALCGDGSSVAVGSGSSSAVGSGMRSTQRGDGGLGTGSGVDLARSSSGQTVRGDPFLARVHSTKAAKSEEFGPDKGIHRDTMERKSTEKTRNKMEGNCFGRSFGHVSQGSTETRSSHNESL